jgi:hypothetical protein
VLLAVNNAYFVSCALFYVTLIILGILSCGIYVIPITVGARSKVRTVFARPNDRSWVRVPITPWKSVCVYSMFVLFCV